MPRMIQRKITRLRYLPSTISVMDTGALTSRLRVLLRRSSLNKRMLMRGDISSSSTAAKPSSGEATMAVMPWLAPLLRSCDWICRNSCR